MITLSGNELKGVPHIRADANRALRQMTEHLLKLGKRRLLFLAHYSPEIRPGIYLWAFSERLKGFKSALKANKGTLVDAFSRRNHIQGRVLVSDSETDVFDPYRNCHQIMRNILAESERPDAVVCGNDDWAIGAMAATREAGLQIPQDIAFTGYDNISQGQYLDVPLTTVAQPSQIMAERSVEMLLAMIRKKKNARFPHLTQFPCQLVIRKSCGA